MLLQWHLIDLDQKCQVTTSKNPSKSETWPESQVLRPVLSPKTHQVQDKTTNLHQAEQRLELSAQPIRTVIFDLLSLSSQGLPASAMSLVSILVLIGTSERYHYMLWKNNEWFKSCCPFLFSLKDERGSWCHLSSHHGITRCAETRGDATWHKGSSVTVWQHLERNESTMWSQYFIVVGRTFLFFLSFNDFTR